ncbi:hypothetical protein NPIL_405971 [Nephila pilipes]|uniref:Uncharacterized protein n=1 Tax=Nephila pilipes TaxID=299642 RepID=A0A8X6TSQ8_NEPPI|nr:hypothetical protein NPIL_405971 [Nephila pilipes]
MIIAAKDLSLENDVAERSEFVKTFSATNLDLSKRIRCLGERKKDKIFTKKRIAWIILKILILIICILCFLYQSTKFCILYYTYPTTLSLAVTKPEVIIKPAFTFCNSGGVNRTYFCSEYPHLCMKPRNLTQFCEQYPFNCRGDNSNLMIPKADMKYRKEIYKALRHIHLSSSLSQAKGNPWSLSVTGGR